VRPAAGARVVRHRPRLRPAPRGGPRPRPPPEAAESLRGAPGAASLDTFSQAGNGTVPGGAEERATLAACAAEVLGVMQPYVAWMDIGLITDERWAPLLGALLSMPSRETLGPHKPQNGTHLHSTHPAHAAHAAGGVAGLEGAVHPGTRAALVQTRSGCGGGRGCLLAVASKRHGGGGQGAPPRAPQPLPQRHLPGRPRPRRPPGHHRSRGARVHLEGRGAGTGVPRGRGGRRGGAGPRWPAWQPSSLGSPPSFWNASRSSSNNSSNRMGRVPLGPKEEGGQLGAPQAHARPGGPWGAPGRWGRRRTACWRWCCLRCFSFGGCGGEEASGAAFQFLLGYASWLKKGVPQAHWGGTPWRLGGPAKGGRGPRKGQHGKGGGGQGRVHREGPW